MATDFGIWNTTILNGIRSQKLHNDVMAMTSLEPNQQIIPGIGSDESKSTVLPLVYSSIARSQDQLMMTTFPTDGSNSINPAISSYIWLDGKNIKEQGLAYESLTSTYCKPSGDPVIGIAVNGESNDDGSRHQTPSSGDLRLRVQHPNGQVDDKLLLHMAGSPEDGETIQRPRPRPSSLSLLPASQALAHAPTSCSRNVTQMDQNSTGIIQKLAALQMVNLGCPNGPTGMEKDLEPSWVEPKLGVKWALDASAPDDCADTPLTIKADEQGTQLACDKTFPADRSDHSENSNRWSNAGLSAFDIGVWAPPTGEDFVKWSSIGDYQSSEEASDWISISSGTADSCVAPGAKPQQSTSGRVTMRPSKDVDSSGECGSRDTGYWSCGDHTPTMDDVFEGCTNAWDQTLYYAAASTQPHTLCIPPTLLTPDTPLPNNSAVDFSNQTPFTNLKQEISLPKQGSSDSGYADGSEPSTNNPEYMPHPYSALQGPIDPLASEFSHSSSSIDRSYSGACSTGMPSSIQPSDIRGSFEEFGHGGKDGSDLSQILTIDSEPIVGLAPNRVRDFLPSSHSECLPQFHYNPGLLAMRHAGQHDEETTLPDDRNIQQLKQPRTADPRAAHPCNPTSFWPYADMVALQQEYVAARWQQMGRLPAPFLIPNGLLVAATLGAGHSYDPHLATGGFISGIPLPTNHDAHQHLIQMRLSRSPPTSEFQSRLEECCEQYKQLERERKKTEAELARNNLGKKISSTNTISIPRLPSNPSRIDRLLIDYFRENARVITLLEKIEQLLNRQLPGSIHNAMQDWLESLRSLQHLRMMERTSKGQDHRAGPSLVTGIMSLSRDVRRARSALWASLLFSLHPPALETV